MVNSATDGVVTSRILSEQDARVLTDRIRSAAEDLWALLLEAYEGKAWAALGYGSWREYATAEFDFSERRAYQLLDQGRVIAALEEASCTKVQISEREARRLKPHLTRVTAEVRERVESGEKPTAAVRAVVKQYGGAVGPKTADALSKEHQVRVPSTDGTVYDGIERDDEAIADYLDNTFSVYRALEAMAQHPWTVAELVERIPDYQRSQIDDHLDRAYGWLTEFRNAWRAKHG